ncbi:MAG TPA: serine hydrolase domain-containing protein [Acetobacteraceae bacterium]|jgi:CubicO group peptidase (beta-lactamase class C family)|nr:serine hydrolase domain-containing protein [Acetobacteraceae bacterium]
MWTRRSLLLAASAPVLGALAPDAPSAALAPDAPSAAERAAMARVAEEFRSSYAIPGLSVAISRNGNLVYVEAFGVADSQTGERLTPGHRFRIASVSKSITSVTIFRLIEQGRLRLGDRVFGPGAILGDSFGPPPYRSGVDQITIDHLLTHTAGGWPNDDRDPATHNPQWSLRALIDWAIHNVALDRTPGTNFAYSNFGYCVLGRVIEHLTGQRYDDFVRQDVLRHCDVTGMAIGGNTLAERQPMEVRYDGQRGEQPYAWNVARTDSYGGWVARPTDLVNFALRVDGFPEPPDILQPATIRTMTTPSVASPSYARGWWVNGFGDYWHTGSMPGSATIVTRTHDGFCWAAFANSRRPETGMEGNLEQLPREMRKQVATWSSW